MCLGACEISREIYITALLNGDVFLLNLADIQVFSITQKKIKVLAFIYDRLSFLQGCHLRNSLTFIIKISWGILRFPNIYLNAVQYP